jgi:paraquat-inducible protein B
VTQYDEEVPLRDEKGDDAPSAKVHLSRWSPWIWIIPVIAIFGVGWLIVRYGLMGGGDITVRFAEARGLDRYSPVRFRGAKVGTVQKITIDDELKSVIVRISMDTSMQPVLRKGTRFWIVEPGIDGGGLGGFLSGTYVGVAPAEGEANGEEVSEFVGQEYPPVLAAPEAGKTFVLQGEGVGSLAVGSPVLFQGIRVGRILGSEYDDTTGVTSVHVFVVQRFANNVRESSRFYRAGGLSVGFGGGGLSVEGVSLGSLLSAPIAFYTPEVLAGAPAPEGKRFELLGSLNVAMASAGGPHLTYLTYIPGPVHGLTPGTPVQMKGVTVGRVRDVRLRYVPETASLETPVTLEIDPRKLEMPVSDATTIAELRGTMNDALAKMVQKGMRATLATSLVLPGASAVSLENVGKPGTARLVLNNDPPIIPAAADANGLAGAMSALTGVADTIKGLPLQEIAGNMRSASQRLDTLLSDPRLDQSLSRLNTSLAEIEKAATTTNRNIEPIAKSLRNAAESAESAAKTVDEVASKANANVEPLVQSLRNAASSAEAAAKRAEQLIGTSQKQGYDISELIRELTRAAEAVRALASYLTENPDAVLKGRRE